MLRLQIAGNLGADAELRTLEGGRSVISFSVAHSERWKDRQSGEQKEKTTWVRCALWRTEKQSVKIADHLTRGRSVFVEGTPVSSHYTPSGSNDIVDTLELNVRHIELLGGASTQKAQPTSTKPAAQPVQNASAEIGAAAQEDTSDDLPF